MKDSMEIPQWREAKRTEIDFLNDHDVWELTKLPEGLVGSKWVFKTKVNEE